VDNFYGQGKGRGRGVTRCAGTIGDRAMGRPSLTLPGPVGMAGTLINMSGPAS